MKIPTAPDQSAQLLESQVFEKKIQIVLLRCWYGQLIDISLKWLSRLRIYHDISTNTQQVYENIENERLFIYISPPFELLQLQKLCKNLNYKFSEESGSG